MHPVPTPARPASGVPASATPTVDLTFPRLSVPEGAHGVLITAVDGEHAEILEGHWIFNPDWAERWDGDVVATLGTCHAHGPGLDGVHLECYLVHDGRIVRLGQWCGLGATWPEALRHPAAAAMSLHTQLEEAGHRCAQRIAN
jgi:hypothetical protein